MDERDGGGEREGKKYSIEGMRWGDLFCKPFH